MAKWIKQYRPKPFIDRLNKSRKLNEAGQVQFGGFDMFVVPAKLNGIIEMSANVPESEKYSIIKQAIWVAGKERITKDSLIREVTRQEKEYLKAPKKKYVLVTSVSVNHHRCQLSNVRMHGCSITFGKKLPGAFLRARKKAKEDYHYITRRIEFPRDYIVAKVTVSEKTPESAAEEAFYVLSLTRGFLNLANNMRHGYSFSLGGTRKPINEIVLGPFHTLHERSGKLAFEGIWHEPEYHEPLRTFSPPVVGEFAKIVDFALHLRNCTKKSLYRSDLEDALVRYNAALDSYNYNTGYIELWSVLEHLTETLKQRYDVTIRRAAFLWEDYEGALQTLSLLRDFRNNLVHKGSTSRTIEIFIYDLKKFIEQLLLFHIFNKYKLTSLSEAARFLDQPTDVSIMDKKMRLLNYAKKFRTARVPQS